jgi:hypothetical protein
MKKQSLLIASLFFFLLACSPRTPLEKFKKDLNRYPEYSIILEDMREDGNFFKDYYHKYKLVYGEKANPSDSALTFKDEITDWREIEKKEFEKFYPYLGMVIASKSKDGKIDDSKYPPGYQYVGNQRYGQWRTDNNGNSFWAWYGKFAMMSTVFGMLNRPVYRNDWNDYGRSRRSGGDYFGRNNTYGTNGSYTKTSKPNFYQRRTVREQAKKSSFSQKVKQRVRRSNMSRVRSRSSRGFGK